MAEDATNGTLRVWLVTVDMGLGHQRATHPLMHFAEGDQITVGKNSATQPEETKLWQRLQNTYDTLSRIRSIPIIGKPLFGMLDTLQNIPPFYPVSDMSKPSFQVKLIASSVDKGLCSGMLETIASQPLPMLTSHPIPAIAADLNGHGLIYCIVPDAEISRAWVAEDPKESRIRYLAPCGRAVMRLRSYGVPDERIFLTGFPFPQDVLGDENLSLLKGDQAQRLHYLDPEDRFWPLHGRNVRHFLGKGNCKFRAERKLTITYAVGGAGAQREIGAQIVESLANKLKAGTVKINLVAGVRDEVREYFDAVKQEVLPSSDDLRVIYASEKKDYFDLFSDAIRQTDVLWTKPSELSFFCGLGIPIIMAPTIGSQELFNRKWLLEVQAAMDQLDPAYTNEWLFDLLNEGRLAESSWDGFLKARKFGLYKIAEVLDTGTMTRDFTAAQIR